MKVRTPSARVLFAVLLAAGAIALVVQQLVVEGSPGDSLPTAAPVDDDSSESTEVGGDAWVLHLLKDRGWSAAEVRITTREPGETVRMIAWGQGEWLETRERDQHLYEARIDRVQLAPGEHGYAVFDRRFQKCPAPTRGRVLQPREGPPIVEPDAGEVQFGRFAHLLWPWHEVRSVIEPRVERINVLRTFERRGRETHEVRFTFRTDFDDEALVRWAEQNRDGWVYWIDADTGIVVKEDFAPVDDSADVAEEVEIVAVDDHVMPPELGDIVAPAGPIQYRAEVEIDERGRPLPERDHKRIEMTASSDGTTSLDALLEELQPAGAQPLGCAPDTAPSAQRPDHD